MTCRRYLGPKEGKMGVFLDQDLLFHDPQKTCIEFVT